MNTCPHCQQPLRGSYCRNQACRELALQRLNEQLRARQYGFDRPPAPFLVTSRDTLPQILDQIRDHWDVLTRNTPPEVIRRLTVLREEFDAFARDFTVASHAAGYARLLRVLRAWVVDTLEVTVCHPLTSGYRYDFTETLLDWAEGTYYGDSDLPRREGFFGDLPVDFRLDAGDKRRLTQRLQGTQALFRLPTGMKFPLRERANAAPGTLCYGNLSRFLGSNTSGTECALDCYAPHGERELYQPMRIGFPSKSKDYAFDMEYGVWPVPVSWIEEFNELWRARFWGPVDWSSLETARATLYTPLPFSRFLPQPVDGESD